MWKRVKGKNCFDYPISPSLAELELTQSWRFIMKNWTGFTKERPVGKPEIGRGILLDQDRVFELSNMNNYRFAPEQPRNKTVSSRMRGRKNFRDALYRQYNTRACTE